MSNNTPNNVSFNIFSSQFLADRPQLVKFLSWWKTYSLQIYLGIIIVSSFFTFFAVGRQDAKKTDCFPKIGDTCYLATYSSHSDLYWDENFHIASAQRYLKGYFFMEPHPPLGKLIIALGEKIINPNSNLNTDQLAFGSNDGDSLPFIPNSTNDTNVHSFVSFKDGYVPKVGETATFSFSGMRFFPVLMAWLVAPLIFILLYLLINNKHIAFLFSLGYVFDNTLIVHSRGAMVDGIQLFFIISSLCYFVYLMKQNTKEKYLKNINFALLGLLVGLAVATKVNGLIIAPLGLFLIVKQIWDMPYLQKKYLLRTITILAVATVISLAIAWIINKFGPIQIDTDGKNDPVEIANIEKKNFEGLKNFYILDGFVGLVIFIFSFKIANKYSLGYWWRDEIQTKKLEENKEINEQMNYKDWQDIRSAIGKWVTQVCIFFFVIGAVFCGSYYAHFSIANKVLMPKDYLEVFAKKEINQNNTQTSIQTSTDPKSCPERNQNGCQNGNTYPNYIEPDYRKILEKGEQTNLSNFWTQLKSHLWYTHVFEKGVPSFDPTKGNNEAGSLPFTWPFGNHPIRYTVTPNVVTSPDNDPEKTITYISYLYLIPNIFIWLMVFIGILLCLVLIVGRVVFGFNLSDNKIDNTKFWWICLFTGMYIAYMTVMVNIHRVMYLYHYFLPLIFGLISTALLFDYYFNNQKTKENQTTPTNQSSNFKTILAIILGIFIGIGIITVFVIFAPFSYRFDLTEAGFNFRNWSKYWALVR